MVQRRAARYVSRRNHNTSSVTAMLEPIGWESLESRRKKLQLITLFKTTKGFVDIPPYLYLRPNTGRTRAGQTNSFHIQTICTDSLKHSFFPATIKLWNSLPASTAEAPDLTSFKRELSLLNI
jgi:hypothetical protein